MEYIRYTEEEINEAVDTIKTCCKNMLEHADEISDEENKKFREIHKFITEFSEDFRHNYESMTKN